MSSRNFTRRRLLIALSLSPASALAQNATGAQSAGARKPAAEDDIVLRAMRDELARSGKLYGLGGDKVYYAEYTIDESEAFSVAASMGAVLNSRTARFRFPRVQVRIGSAEFDNTNSVFSDLFSRGLADRLVIDDNYNAIRHHLWLITDAAYKGAVQAISRKRSALQNAAEAEKLPDFGPAEAGRVLRPKPKSPRNEAAWTARVRSFSAVMQSFPEILSSGVEIEFTDSTSYYVNTEGAEFRTPETIATVRARVTAQAPNGSNVRNAFITHALTPDLLPPEAEIRATMQNLARDVVALSKAPAAERYIGPVLFEPLAAAQIFADVFAPQLAIPRKPVAPPNASPPFRPSELEGRIGSRVLPEWIDVVDDPALREYKGKRLFGSYDIDVEGVVPKALTLVEQGTLRNYLMTRQPVKGQQQTNGRARLPGVFGAHRAAAGNLFVRASKKDDLKAKLMEIIKGRSLPHGLLIRKMDFPSTAGGDELRQMMLAAQSRGATQIVSAPLLAYQVYPDGREELVRGLRFRGFQTRSFRDIVAASGDEHILDFLNNGAPMAVVGGGGYVCPSTVVAPGVLFEELELEPVDEQLQKPPIVPPPVATG